MNCKFTVKTAVIIHQKNYELLRLHYPKLFQDLPATEQDAINARKLAHGFNIPDEEIIFIEDKPITEIKKILWDIARRFKALGLKGERTFLFVYCAGHGVADQRQYIVLNGTSGNLYPIEAELRSIVGATQKMCTVFAVYDMCKDQKERYKELKS